MLKKKEETVARAKDYSIHLKSPVGFVFFLLFRLLILSSDDNYGKVCNLLSVGILGVTTIMAKYPKKYLLIRSR